MLRAIISDNASNQKVTDPMFVTILPGIDLSWDLTQLDRLVIRTGSGQIFTLNSTIISNEPFSESFEATLQLAPADRDSNVEWTTISTETIPIGAMSDLSHEISWKFSLTSGGQWDVRVLLDSGEIIDEEGNITIECIRDYKCTECIEREMGARERAKRVRARKEADLRLKKKPRLRRVRKWVLPEEEDSSVSNLYYQD